MKLLKKILALLKKSFIAKKPQQNDITQLARIVAERIDRLVLNIFTTHQGRLCFEPINFIIPAVWGSGQHKELVPVQKEIHEKVVPAIDEMIEILDIKGLDDSQTYALGFILRWTIISKTTYMIQIRKKRNPGPGSPVKIVYPLDIMEPMGTC